MDDFTTISLVTTLGGILMFLLISFAVRAPGANLSKKFASIGVLKGKTYREISSVVGQENAKSFIVDKDGKPVTVRQWMQTGYHVVLLFDEKDICLGVSSETSV